MSTSRRRFFGLLPALGAVPLLGAKPDGPEKVPESMSPHGQLHWMVDDEDTKSSEAHLMSNGNFSFSIEPSRSKEAARIYPAKHPSGKVRLCVVYPDGTFRWLQ